MRKHSQLPDNFFVTTRDFSGGLNTQTDPSLLKDNELTMAEGIVVDEPLGTASKILGATRVSALDNFHTDTLFADSFEYVKSDGTRQHVVCLRPYGSYTWQVWYARSVDHNFAAMHVNGDVVNFASPVSFACLDGILFMTDGISKPLVWNGVSAKHLNGVGVDFDGNPIANFDLLSGGATPGKHITTHQNRILMANTIENNSEIIFSDFLDNNGEVIKATNAAAWQSQNQLNINSSDGNEITAITSYMGVLVVFKKSSIYVVSGDLRNPVTSLIVSDKGTIHASSVRYKDGFLIFLGDDGVYAFDGRSARNISENIRASFNGIPQRIASEYKTIISSAEQWNEGTKLNVEHLGQSEGAIRCSRNIVISGEREFSDNRGYINNVSYMNGGLELAVLDNKPTITSTITSREKSGVIQSVNDGDTGTYWEHSSSGGGMLTTTADETIQGDIVVTFPAATTIKSVGIVAEVSYSLLSSTDAEKVMQASIYAKSNTGKSVSLYNGSRGRGKPSGTINIEMTNHSLESDPWTNVSEVRFNFYVRGVAANAINPRVTIILRIREIYLVTGDVRQPSGKYTTGWIDCGRIVQSSELLPLSFASNVPPSTTLSVYYAVASNNNTVVTPDSVTWHAISSGGTASQMDGNRYVAYRVDMDGGAYGSTPTLTSITQQFAEAASWTGQFPAAGSLVSWGFFYASASANGGTISYEISPSGGGGSWVSITNGYDIGTIQSLAGVTRPYIRVTMNRGSQNDPPIVYAISISYFTTETRTVLCHSAVHDGRYYLNINKANSNNQTPDLMLILNRNNAWTAISYTGPYARSLLKTHEYLYGFKFHTYAPCIEDLNAIGYYRLFTSKTFDAAIASPRLYHVQFEPMIRTKTFILGEPSEEFLIREIYLRLRGDLAGSSFPITVRIYNENNLMLLTRTLIFDINDCQSNPVKINCNVKVNRFYAMILPSSAGDSTEVRDFGLVSMSFYIRPLRISTKYYDR